MASDLREPGFKPSDEQAAAAEREVAIGVGPGHQLWGREFTARACCTGCDRVLFSLDDETRAIVHLTWTGRRENDPWPKTE
jgi:hypothetical protein